jgi:type IV secretory pathway TraG/TraD family ATPase VirD4
MQTFYSIYLLNIQLRHIYVLKLLIMSEISLITVIYKRIGKFWHITQSELNSCKWRYVH